MDFSFPPSIFGSGRNERALVFPYTTDLVFVYEPTKKLSTYDANDLTISIANSISPGTNDTTAQSDVNRRLLRNSSNYNGRPSLSRGANTNPYLRSATGLALSHPFVIYCAAEAESNPAGTLLFDGNSAGARALLWCPTATTMQMLGASGGGISINHDLLNNKTVFTCIFDDASSALWVDNVPAGTGTTGTAAIDSIVKAVRFSLGNGCPLRKAIFALQRGRPSDPNLSANTLAIMEKFGS